VHGGRRARESGEVVQPGSGSGSGSDSDSGSGQVQPRSTASYNCVSFTFKSDVSTVLPTGTRCAEYTSNRLSCHQNNPRSRRPHLLRVSVPIHRRFPRVRHQPHRFRLILRQQQQFGIDPCPLLGWGPVHCDPTCEVDPVIWCRRILPEANDRKRQQNAVSPERRRDTWWEMCVTFECDAGTKTQTFLWVLNRFLVVNIVIASAMTSKSESRSASSKDGSPRQRHFG
jgi:hypothetical protein